MTNQDIVRGWKDEDYLLNLSIQERAFIPDNPAGLTELTDEELVDVDGGTTPSLVAYSLVFCTPAVKVSFIASVVASAATATIIMS